MIINVKRKWYTEESTIGEMVIEGTDFKCYTLELPPHHDNTGCIATGEYILDLLPSHRFQRYMPTVLHVPGRTGILIHAGNFPKDTQGCILVGKLRQENAVVDSRAAFDDLMSRMAGEMRIKIEDAALR